MNRLLSLVTIVVSLLWMPGLHAATGDLDGSFGSGGVVSGIVGDELPFSGNGASVIEQSDGKFVVIGTGGPAAQIMLVRLNVDGSLDAGFGESGRAFIRLGDDSGNYTYSGIQQADNKIVVVGYSLTDGNNDLFVARFSEDGLLDSGFADNGVLIFDQGYNDHGTGVAQQADGKLVVVGNTYDSGGEASSLVFRLNTDGSYDSSFATNGVWVSSLVTGLEALQGVAIQDDGKAVAAGYTFEGAYRKGTVIRFDLNGVPDTSFHIDGISMVDLGGDTWFHDLVIQSDGQILCAGWFLNDMLVTQFGSNGYINDTWATSGSRWIDLGLDSFAYDVILQPTGEILLSGTTNSTITQVVRFDSSGNYDTSFNSNGKLALTFSSSTETAYELLYTSTGKLVLAGRAFDAVNGVNDISVARLNLDGSLDTTFDSDGYTLISAWGSEDYNKDLIVQSDDKLLSVGYSWSSGKTNLEMSVARYTDAGLLDATFDGDGRATFSVGTGHSYAYGGVQQADGKIVLAGHATFATTGQDITFVRLNQDGSLDNTFDSDGIQNVDINGQNDTDSAYSVSLQVDGKILAAGHNNFYQSVVVVRLNTDGSPDNSFSADGVRNKVFGTTATAEAVIQQADGKILSVGRAVVSGQNDSILVRFNTDGTDDAGFGTSAVINLSVDPNFTDVAYDVVQQTDGKLLVVGKVNDGIKDHYYVARLNLDGSVDTDFGSSGYVTGTIGGSPTVARSILLDADQKIVVAGYAEESITESNPFLLRLNSDGSFDNTFGTSGIKSLTTTPADYVFAVGQQSSGNYVISGQSNPAINSYLMRFINASLDSDGDGMVDTSDNCPNDANAGQEDLDNDLIGDVCDDDADGDGASASDESLAGTSDLDNTVRPWWTTYYGVKAGDNFGMSVSGAGDVNGDGYDDFIIGARLDDSGGSANGSVYVYSGLDGSFLYRVDGDNLGDQLGWSVSEAGDVNNDGYGDFIAGAHFSDVGGQDHGMARVYSGVDGSTLHSFYPDAGGGQFGESVSAAGDVNNDGYADLIVGAPFNGTAGATAGMARVYSGLNGDVLYTFQGAAGERLGYSVSDAGDVNNDGYADVMVGSTYSANGTVKVFSGLDGSELHSINGEASGDRFGYGVSGVGDINQDGYDDFMGGAIWGDMGGGNAGYARVYSGLDASLIHTVNGASLDNLGAYVSGARDVNGDGYVDFLASAYYADNNGNDSGSLFLYSGKDASVLVQMDGDAPSDLFSRALNGLGDIDNDGYGDFAGGTYNHNTGAGMIRVVRSSDLFNDVDRDFIVNSADTDDDGDGMPDDWENSYAGLDPLLDDANGDLDGDGISNLDEYLNGTDPTVPDGKVYDDFTNDGIAGWIWRGVTNGIEGQNRTWSPNWSLSLPGWVIPARTYPPDWDAALEYDVETTGDFNGDGDADWLWRAQGNGDGRWKVWQMEGGSRGGQNNPPDFDSDHEWTVAGSGDTDKDEDDDVILFNSTTGEILIWEMQNYLLNNTHSVGTKAGYDVARIGDFDYDGDVDLLLQVQGGNTLRFWELESNGLVQEISTQQTGSGFATQCAGDFNGDGHTDVYLLAGDGTSKWFEYVNFVRQQQVFGANQSDWILMGCSDYDGDGDADMIWTSADGMGYNKVFVNESFNNEKTFYFNRYGGTNPSNPGYGYEVRTNGN